MKKFCFFNRIAIWSALFAALLFVFSSCEVGLGSAVDTQAPVVSFAEKTVGSGGVIRDSFMVYGNWTDDGNIKEVNAKLTKTDGSKLSFENKGKVETTEVGKGSWNAVFDPFKEKIPDGSYELSITMEDTGRHKTTITRAVVIDNTPPLVVLTRPGTKLNDSSFDSYGQKFSLEGKAADDNDVSLVEVNVYEDAARTKLLKTIAIPNVPLTIDLDVAEFSATEVNDYSAIYNILANGLADKTGGTAKRYCSLNIYDGAQRYPADGSVQTEADERGNQTSTYYVNDDEIAKLFTEYKITELYHILNNSFASSAGRSITVDSVKTKLQQQAITGSQFTINPENSPTFVVNSRSPLEEGTTLEEAKYIITSGSSSLQVEISAGLDKHAIKKDTVGIYLKECDKNGLVSDSAQKIWLVRPLPIEGESNPDAQAGAHDEDKVEIVQSGTTYKFTTAATLTPVNFPELQVTKYYKVFVQGEDVKKNDILPKDDQIFAFYLKPDTKFIEVSVTDVKPEWLSWTTGANAANKKYSAKVTFSGGDATNYDVYRNGEKVGSNVSSPFNDEITITSSVHPTEITYKVKGKDAQGAENGAESSEYKVVPDRQYDNAVPTVSNIAYPSTEDTENPTFQFSGNASDAASGVATVYLKISNTDSSQTTGEIPITWTDTHWEKNIKRSDYASGVFASEGLKKVEVWAVDKVGLKSSVVSKTDWVYDTAAPTLNFTDPASITGGLITISGTARDGYGVKKVEVIQQKLGDNDTVVSTITRNANGTTSWASSDLPFKTSSASYTANEIIGDTHPADGKYRYTIKVTDNADKTTEKSVVVTLNTQAPDLVMDTDLDVWFASKNVSVSGTASAVSPATVSKVYYIINPTGTVTYPTATTVPSGWASAIGTTNWAVNLPADKVNDSPNNKLYLATVDNVGNVGKFGPYDIKVDSSVAELKPLYYNIEGTDIFRKAEGNIYVDGSKDLIVYGEYYDNQSGVNTLSFKLKNATFATKELKYSTNEIVENVDKDTLEGFTWGNFSSNVKYFKATFKASDFTESNVGDLKVFGSNGATASVDAKICSISFDNTKPQLANVQFKSVDTKFNVYEKSTGVYYVNKTKKFNITGVATDVGGGVQDVKLIIGSADPIDRDTSNNPNSWTFSNVDLSGQTGTSVTLKLKVIDVAGNDSGDTYKYTFNFDQTEPEALHWADDKGKDVYFRIGNADNDRLSTNSTKVESGEGWEDSLDTGVGSKYSYGSYGKDSNIQIRGNFEDNTGGAGLKMIYYKIFDLNTTSDSDITTAISNLESKNSDTTPDGSFEPIAIDDQVEKRVVYNVKINATTYEKKSVKIKSNYIADITGFNGVNNCLILIAEDNVGNRKADTLVVNRSVSEGTITASSGNNNWNSKKAYYGINKDTVVPGITTNITQGTFTNTKQPVSVSGTASDAASGLNSVKLYIDEEVDKKGQNAGKIQITWSKIIKVEDYTAGTTYNWSEAIPGSVFADVKSGSSLTVYATAKDKAGDGNEKTISAATITIDTEAPTVEINTPSDADTTTQDVDVNGQISLLGTADDFYGVGQVLGLCFKKAATATAPASETPTSAWTVPSGWTKLSLTPSGTTSWKFENINTAGLTGVSDGDTVWFTVAVQDKAGNVGYAAPQKVIVNQNTDRPVVKFTNLANAGTDAAPQYILKYGTNSQLEGNISDDDATSTAVVDIFVASSTQLTSAPTNGSGWTKTTNNNDITWSHATYGTTKYNKTTGDYTYTPGVTADGSKEVYFFVKDNKGKEFYTAHATKLNKPYQQFKQFAKTSNDAVLKYKSDGTSPVINSIEIQPYTDNTKNGNPVTPGTSTIVGGKDKNKIQFIIKAQDGNGIKNMSLTYTPDGGSATTITTANSGSFTASTTNVETTWTTAVIPVSSILAASGSVNIAVTVNDQCELFANSNTVFLVDNEGPEISITSPKSTDEMTGKFSISGISTEKGNAGVSSINFIVPTKAQRDEAGTTEEAKTAYYEALPDSSWGGKLHAGATLNAFRYDFDGDTVNENALFDIYTKDDTGGIYGLSANANEIYTVPMIFRSKDKLGNVSISEYSINFNPDADKPKTEITYPSSANYTAPNQYVTLGGTIRVTGSVSIPSLTTTPEKVYIQIASEDSDFGDADKAKAGTGNGNYGYTVKTISNVASDIGKAVTGLTSPDAWWGIEVTRSSNSWSFNLNDSETLNPTGEDPNKIKIRACAVNALGKMGTWSDPVSIQIDASTPQYETKLYQFGGTPAVGSQTAEIEYEPGIYIKGQWYLGLHIQDDDTVVFENAKQNDHPVEDSNITKIFSNSNKTLDLFIKLDPDASETQTYRITARDNAGGNYHYITPSCDINVDNDAPALNNIKGNGDVLTNGSIITEKNYVYTISGEADDSGSGFERLLFYFVRPGKELINPMIPYDKANPISKVNLTGLTTFTVDGATMYGKNVSGTIVGDKFTPGTAANITGNSHIRAGGLIFVEGVYRKIKSISNAGLVTLETNTGITTSKNVTAGFPYGQVIDNTSTEKTEGDGRMANPFVITNDDGDQMPETVNKMGSSYSWDGTIHSKNMPDGPVTLVLVAFDKAGNVSTLQYTTSVQNNAPRLAKVYLGTDLNRDDSVSDTEFELYNVGASTNSPDGIEAYSLTTASFSNYVKNAKDEWVESTSTRKAFTVKKDLVVLPEFVGGNGEIKVVFNNNDTTTGPDGHQTGTGTAVLSKTGTLSAPSTITGDYWKFSNLGTDGADKKMSFTFWDSTEELTPGKDTQYAFLRITDLNVDQVDDVKPNVVIKPFFWNDEDDNSLYENSKNNGHIELEKDLTDTVKSTYGTDPKVSGKIKIEGYAYDDTCLGSLWVNFTDFTFNNTITAAGQNDLTAKYWTSSSVSSNVTVSDGSFTYGGNNYKQAAYYDSSSGWQESTATMAADGWQFSVDADDDGAYFSQLGHRVKWTLLIDTAKITKKAGLNKNAIVLAMDSAGKNITNTTSVTGDESHAVNNVPSYQMDVVPYLTAVKRNSAYNTHRSGMGNYPMMREEEGNAVTGFNLGTTGTENTARLYISSGPNAITGLSVEALTVSGNTATFKIPATAVDGYLQYYVHISDSEDVPALNNMNNNAAYTKEEGDSRWYDDRFVKIWQSNANDKFAASYPTYPAMAMGSNGDLFMSYTFYSKSVVYYNQLMSNTKTQIFTAGDQPEETDIMINGTNEVNVIYQANHHYGGSQDRWSAKASGAGSINLYNPSAPYIGTYALGNYWRFEGCWHNQMLQQLKNAKVATSGNNVYHTIWYDKITKAIKYSNVNKSATQDAYIPDDNDNNHATTRPGEIGWVVLDGDADLDDIVQTNQRTTNGYNGGESKYPNNTFNHPYLNGIDENTMYSIALSKTPGQRTAIMDLSENSTRRTRALNANPNYTRYDYTGAGTGTTGYNVDCYESVSPTSTCGEYAAICVTSKGYPVVVYFDVDNKMLKVARGMNTNPKGMNTANTSDGAAAWRIQKVALTDGHLGNDASYVSAAIDSSGYLHIAFQNSRGELIYTRSTNTATELTLTQGFTFAGSVIVDTNGTWASITVDSNNVPQIAYMANTSGYDTLKLAYPVESTTAPWTAATTWETMYAPMNAKSSNVKTCVVARPSNATGGQPTGLTTYWKTGIGFATSEDYRVMKYIGSGTKAY